jgi:transposase
MFVGSVPSALHACNGKGALREVKAPTLFRSHTLAG